MKYLSPILNTFPKVFCEEMNKVKITALGVYDVHYYKSKETDMQPYLFMLIPYNQRLINASRATRYLVDEYPYNLEDKYMLVFDVSKYKESYEQFLKGNYSKMYTKTQLKEIKVPQIWQGEINSVYLVLTKNKLGLKYLKDTVKAVYGTDQIADNPEEYDIPPRINQEVFNWKGNEDYIRTNTPLRNI